MVEKWIIPCSPKFFDVVDHFENNTRIVWKRSSSIHKDDIVYIYVGKPYGEIKYRCHVIDENVSEEIVKENQYAVPKASAENYKYLMLELDYSYPAGTFDFQTLKAHGLGQVQKQARIYKDLIEYINIKESELKEERG